MRLPPCVLDGSIFLTCRDKYVEERRRAKRFASGNIIETIETAIPSMAIIV